MKQFVKVAWKFFAAVAGGCALAFSVACAAGPRERTAAPPAPAPEIAVTVPDAAWVLRIERVVAVDHGIWIIARLGRRPGPAAQMISTARAALPVALPDEPWRVFVAGKTWSWKNPEPYEFVPSLAPVLARAAEGRVLYAAPDASGADSR